MCESRENDVLTPVCDSGREPVRRDACAPVVSTGSVAHALEAGVSSLARLVRPTATVFYWIGADREPSGFELFGVAESMHRIYLQRYCRIDPLHPSRFASQSSSVLTLKSELPSPLRDRSAYWQRFLYPHGVTDVMEVLLREGGQPAAAFSLLRMGPAEPFSIDELGRAQALQPLLEAALTPHWRRERPLRAHAPGGRGLTHREQQIARLVREGLSNKDIARTLELAQPTVKTHLLRMFRKLGVSSRTALISELFL
jgi:DNA-binding CsgD family transcriptional regulator